MRTGYIIKTWFEEPQDILESLIKNETKFTTDSTKDEAIFLDKSGIVYRLHCSVGDNLVSCKKLKVYAWDVFGDEFKDLQEKMQWEDELGDAFYKKYLEELLVLKKEVTE